MQLNSSLVLGSFASMMLAVLTPLAHAQSGAGSTPTTADAPPAAPQKLPATPPVAESAPVAERAFVVMETSKGPIVLELDGKNAPLSVANFLRYADKGYYDGTIFHRVIGSFMIQGGGFDKDGAQKPTEAPIKNEWKNGQKNAVGTIAFARTDNPDSATSQFFINVGDNSELKDRAGVGYAVFGKVVAGMDTVNTIKSVKTGQRTLMARSGEKMQPMPSRDVPLEVVTIDSVRRVSDEVAKEKIAALKANPASAPSGAAPGGTAPTAPSAPKAPPAGSGAPPKAPPAGGGTPPTPPAGR